MRRRILQSTLLVVTITALVLGVPLGITTWRLMEDFSRADLLDRLFDQQLEASDHPATGRAPCSRKRCRPRRVDDIEQQPMGCRHPARQRVGRAAGRRGNHQLGFRRLPRPLPRPYVDLDADPRDDALDDAVLALAAELDGSISAEHGIGRAKAHLMPLTRTADEQAAMAALKHALDPAGRLGRALSAGEGARRPA